MSKTREADWMISHILTQQKMECFQYQLVILHVSIRETITMRKWRPETSWKCLSHTSVGFVSDNRRRSATSMENILFVLRALPVAPPPLSADWPGRNSENDFHIQAFGTWNHKSSNLKSASRFEQEPAGIYFLLYRKSRLQLRLLFL